MPHSAPRSDLEIWIEQACLLEATARKPGNVHPEASFVDLAYDDFVVTARVIAPILSRTREVGVGVAIHESIRESRRIRPRNTNLGIVLLLAPLAAVPRELPLSEGIGAVLQRLTRVDAHRAYEAIRLAAAGGLGEVESEDVSKPPTVTLLEAMRLAASRDAIASEYATDFSRVLKRGVPLLAETTDFENRWEESIIRLQLVLMSETPDSLIARKCGEATALEAAQRAKAVLDSGWPGALRGRQALAEFDDWLRADGHRRNPGTTADLVAASLFAGFREKTINVPENREI